MQHQCHLSHRLKVLEVTSDVFVGQVVDAHVALWSWKRRFLCRGVQRHRQSACGDAGSTQGRAIFGYALAPRWRCRSRSRQVVVCCGGCWFWWWCWWCEGLQGMTSSGDGSSSSHRKNQSKFSSLILFNWRNWCNSVFCFVVNLTV